ncbi:DNA methyltransferase [Parasphingorhabdus halotolerans]|uniref:site-specific DNA-methyltransferase (adenine-specific) n=1 Tax=Parasphingorhabdus halotolerans TaxID=2725558 RepID=A0A6H2DNV2_9SPHN|nr:DNA methyltransferase [Parasphingorhabdus halotolerans]QJB70034.1 site-specific DNA-methyltransferase [Parasphingorhabdus halotolerans]
MTNTLYYGDNLKVLQSHIADESVDLIYLDPPFNSNANYNILFKSPDGSDSDAQINAFDDTWSWGPDAEESVDFVTASGNHKTHDLLEAMLGFLGKNDMMAYLAMMAARLIELHRVLKPTGSLYLHCDPTASHYLKLLLDGVFGAENYRNEIVWKRTNIHNDSKTWSKIADTIFFYSKSKNFSWTEPREPHSESHIASKFKNDDNDGRGPYSLSDMTSPNPRPNMMYEWKGFPFPPKGWRYKLETMQRLHDENKIWYPTDSDGYLDTKRRPRLKRFLNELDGNIMSAVWTDINPLNSQAQERLGYPTQKPLALLERIISASSNEGDVVLDPFCGCGTAVDAAEKLGRKWIGIDVTHLAINLIEQRMKDSHPGVQFDVKGRPESLDSAMELARRDKHEFEKWIVPKLDGHLFEDGRKGADGGIDGFIYFKPDGKKTQKAILSVKGGDNVGVAMIRDLVGVMEREKALAGVFITKALPSKPMMQEAAKLGLFESEVSGRKHPRLQIITLAEVFQDRRPDLPWVVSPFRKAQRHDKSGEQGKLI